MSRLHSRDGTLLTMALGARLPQDSKDPATSSAPRPRVSPAMAVEPGPASLVHQQRQAQTLPGSQSLCDEQSHAGNSALSFSIFIKVYTIIFYLLLLPQLLWLPGYSCSPLSFCFLLLSDIPVGSPNGPSAWGDACSVSRAGLEGSTPLPHRRHAAAASIGTALLARRGSEPARQRNTALPEERAKTRQGRKAADLHRRGQPCM